MLSLQREPLEGDFPLLMIRKRGPYSLPCIIRTASSIEEFQELLQKVFTQRNIDKIAARTKTQSACPAWYLYKRCIISGTTAKYILNQNRKGINNQKLNFRLTRTFPSRFKTQAMVNFRNSVPRLKSPVFVRFTSQVYFFDKFVCKVQNQAVFIEAG